MAPKKMWKTCLNIISPIQSHLLQIWSGKIVTLMLQNGQTSSTKWRLGENVVLRLMECLTPTVGFDIFTVNYFTPFRIFNHLGVNFIRAARVLIKNRLCKWTITGNKQLCRQLQKLQKERGHFKSPHQTKEHWN